MLRNKHINLYTISVYEINGMETVSISICLESVRVSVSDTSRLYIAFGLGKMKYFTKVTSQPSDGLYKISFTKTNQIECIFNKSRTKVHTHKLRVRVGVVDEINLEKEVLAEFEIDPAEFFPKNRPEPKLYIIGQCELMLGVAVYPIKIRTEGKRDSVTPSPRRKPEKASSRDEARRKAMNRCILRRKAKKKSDDGGKGKNDDDAPELAFTPIREADLEKLFLDVFHLNLEEKEKILSRTKGDKGEIVSARSQAESFISDRSENEVSMSSQNEYIMSARSQNAALLRPRSQVASVAGARSQNELVMDSYSSYFMSPRSQNGSDIEEDELEPEKLTKKPSNPLIDLSFHANEGSPRQTSDIIDLLGMTSRPFVPDVLKSGPRTPVPSLDLGVTATAPKSAMKQSPGRSDVSVHFRFEPGQNPFDQKKIRDIFTEEWMNCGDLDPGQPADTLFDEIKTVRREDWPSLVSDVVMNIETTSEIMKDDDDKMMFLASVHKLTYFIEDLVDEENAFCTLHDKLSSIVSSGQTDLVSRNAAAIVTDIEECIKNDPSGFDFQIAITDLVQKRLLFDCSRPYSSCLWQYLVQYADEELSNRFLDSPTDQIETVIGSISRSAGVYLPRCSQCVLFMKNLTKLGSGEMDVRELCPSLPGFFLLRLHDSLDARSMLTRKFRDRIEDSFANSPASSRFVHQNPDFTVPISIWSIE